MRRYTRFRDPTLPKIAAEIPFVAVPKMKVSDLIDIWVGGVGSIDQLPVGEVGKKVPIGLPPLLCFGGCLGWHRAEMERGEPSVWLCCVVLCVLVNEMTILQFQ